MTENMRKKRVFCKVDIHGVLATERGLWYILAVIPARIGGNAVIPAYGIDDPGASQHRPRILPEGVFDFSSSRSRA
jgi:hypothetical protein